MVLCMKVDEWLEYSRALVQGSGLEPACKSIDQFLSSRTFLVGHGVTLADLACWGQLQGMFGLYNHIILYWNWELGGG